MRQSLAKLACSFRGVVEILAVGHAALVAMIANSVEYLNSPVLEDETGLLEMADPTLSMWAIDCHLTG